MAKDGIGNELEIGALVQVVLASPYVRARIIALQSGGVAVGGGRRDGQRQVTPGVVTCTLTTETLFDPSTGVAGEVMRLVDPEPEEAKRVIAMVKEHQAKGRSGLLVLQ